MSDAAFSMVERAGVAMSMAQSGGMVPGAGAGLAGAELPVPAPIEPAEGEDPASTSARTGLDFADPYRTDKPERVANADVRAG